MHEVLRQFNNLDFSSEILVRKFQMEIIIKKCLCIVRFHGTFFKTFKVEKLKILLKLRKFFEISSKFRIFKYINLSWEHFKKYC